MDNQRRLRKPPTYLRSRVVQLPEKRVFPARWKLQLGQQLNQQRRLLQMRLRRTRVIARLIPQPAVRTSSHLHELIQLLRCLKVQAPTQPTRSPSHPEINEN